MAAKAAAPVIASIPAMTAGGQLGAEVGSVFGPVGTAGGALIGTVGGAIIGSTSTIAKDVPPYAIVVGNPGKVVKYRFTQAQIEGLLQIKWWDWEEDKIKAEAMDLWSPNICIRSIIECSSFDIFTPRLNRYLILLAFIAKI